MENMGTTGDTGTLGVNEVTGNLGVNEVTATSTNFNSFGSKPTLGVNKVTGTSYNVTSSSSKHSHEPAILNDAIIDASMPDGDGVRVSSIASRFIQGGGEEDINSILYNFTSKMASLDGNGRIGMSQSSDVPTQPITYVGVTNGTQSSPPKVAMVHALTISSIHDFIDAMFGVSLKTLKDIDDFTMGIEEGKYPMWDALESDVRKMALAAVDGLWKLLWLKEILNLRTLNLQMSLLLSKPWTSMQMLHPMLELRV